MDENTSGTDVEERSDTTVLTDRDEVRTWADANDVVPVRSADAETERSELVPSDAVESHHEERQWDSFLNEFEERNLALTYPEAEGMGGYHLVDRTEAPDERRATSETVESELLEGETVETEITEREVVETEVVEETTIESELVDTEVVDTEVVDTEIVGEELVDVAMIEAADADVADRSDRRYFGDDEVVEIEERGAVLLEVDESRVEVEEQVEKKVIESEVAEQHVDEETSVEDEAVDLDIDAVGIHEHIEQTDLVEAESDGVIADRYIETEFDETDTATSTITEHRTVENTVTERKTLLADVTAVDVDETELVNEELVETEVVESGVSAVPGRGLGDDASETSTDGARTESSRSSTDGARTEATGSTAGADAASTERVVDVSGSQMGQTVVTPDADEIGIVADVDEDENRLYVDEDPSTTDKIKAHLHWSDEDEASVLTADQIRELNPDAVVVETGDLR
jgi:hypothetical protein